MARRMWMRMRMRMLTADDKELLERHAVLQSPSRIEELAKVFIHATKVSCPTFGKTQSFADGVQMEIGFWEMYASS